MPILMSEGTPNMSINVKRESILSYGGIALATLLMAAVSFWAQTRAVSELDGFMNGLNQRAKVASALESAMKDRAIAARNLLLANSQQERDKGRQERARQQH